MDNYNQYNQNQQYQQNSFQQDQYQQNQFGQGQYQQNQYQQQYGQYQQPPYGQMNNPYYNQPVQQPNPTFTRNLILSIILILFCPFFLGFVPFGLTISANTSWKNGLYDEYQSKTKAANVFMIIEAIIIGIELLVIIGGFFYFLYAIKESGFWCVV